MDFHQLTVVALSAAAEPSTGIVVATGISIVFSVLLLLYLLITLEGVIFKRIDAKKSGSKPAKAVPAPAPDKSFEAARAQAAPAPAVEAGIPAEVVAAIAAAVACMDGNYTIRSLKRARPARNAWGNAAAAAYTEPF